MSLDDITLAVDYFDLKKIAESGQCFRWKELGPGKYLIPSSQTCAIMEQKEPDDDLHLLIEEGTLPLWQDYLNYGERYGSIVREAREATLADGSPDLFLREAVLEAAGVQILAMPLKANIPDPQRDDWKLVACPICGAECWENDLARQAMAAEPELRAACTTCALKAGVTTGGKH